MSLLPFSSPVPPLQPFTQSSRRPISQPIESDDINYREKSGGYQTDRGYSGGKGVTFPPLISALDTYIESSAESKTDKLIAQLNSNRRQLKNNQNGSDKKKKKKKSKSAGMKANENPSPSLFAYAKTPYSEDGADISTGSSDGMNQTNDILNLEASSDIKYGKSSENSINSLDSALFSRVNISPRAALAAKYLTSTTKTSPTFNIDPVNFTYTVATRPANYPTVTSSASKAVTKNNRHLKSMDPPESPLPIVPMDTAARFSKAIESIAALKLHNYAMRRREQMSQKMKLLKEIRGFEKENNREFIFEQQLKDKQLLAAWKIRFYVEFLRLNTLKHIIRDVEDKNMELVQDNEMLSKGIVELETNSQDTLGIVRKYSNDAKLAAVRDDESKSQISAISRRLEETNTSLYERTKELNSLQELLMEKETRQKELEMNISVLTNELQLTRLTCQDLVKNLAQTDGMLLDSRNNNDLLKNANLRASEVFQEREHDLYMKIEYLQMRNEDWQATSSSYINKDTALQRIMDEYSILDETVQMQDEEQLIWKMEHAKLQFRYQRESENLEMMTKTKDGLQIIVSDVAMKAAASLETEKQLQDAVADGEKKIKKLRKQVKEQEVQIADLETNVKSSFEEVEFLVDENGELAREIEILTMYAEDIRTKYHLSVEAVNNSTGYSRFLEKQLAAARKLEEQRNFGGSASILSAGDLFGDLSEESYTYFVPKTGNADYGGPDRRDELRVGFDEDDLSVRPENDTFNEVPFDGQFSNLQQGSQVVLQLGDIGRNSFVGKKAVDLLDTKRQTDASLALANGGSSILEAKMIFLMNSLEEKMKSVDQAAESLRFLAEKADAIDRVQTVAAMSMLDNRSSSILGDENTNRDDARIGRSSESGSFAATQSLLPSQMVMGGGLEEASVVSHQTKPLVPEAPSTTSWSTNRVLDREFYISKQKTLRQLYSQLKSRLVESNLALVTQRADISELSQEKSRLKKVFSSWKKKFKKSHAGAEASLEDVTADSDIALVANQLNNVVEKLQSQKVLNMDINSKAMVLQTELINVSSKMEENAREFLALFGDELEPLETVEPKDSDPILNNAPDTSEQLSVTEFMNDSLEFESSTATLKDDTTPTNFFIPEGDRLLTTPLPVLSRGFGIDIFSSVTTADSNENVGLQYIVTDETLPTDSLVGSIHGSNEHQFYSQSWFSSAKEIIEKTSFSDEDRKLSFLDIPLEFVSQPLHNLNSDDVQELDSARLELEKELQAAQEGNRKRIKQLQLELLNPVDFLSVWVSPPSTAEAIDSSAQIIDSNSLCVVESPVLTAEKKEVVIIKSPPKYDNDEFLEHKDENPPTVRSPSFIFKDIVNSSSLILRAQDGFNKMSLCFNEDGAAVFDSQIVEPRVNVFSYPTMPSSAFTGLFAMDTLLPSDVFQPVKDDWKAPEDYSQSLVSNTWSSFVPEYSSPPVSLNTTSEFFGQNDYSSYFAPPNENFLGFEPPADVFRTISSIGPNLNLTPAPDTLHISKEVDLIPIFKDHNESNEHSNHIPAVVPATDSVKSLSFEIEVPNVESKENEERHLSNTNEANNLLDPAVVRPALVSVQDFLEGNFGILKVVSVSFFNIPVAARSLTESSSVHVSIHTDREAPQRSRTVENIGSKLFIPFESCEFVTSKKRLEFDIMNLKVVDESSYALETILCQTNFSIGSMETATIDESVKFHVQLFSRKGKPAGSAVVTLKVIPSLFNEDELRRAKEIESHFIDGEFVRNRGNSLESFSSFPMENSEDDEFTLIRPKSNFTIGFSNTDSRNTLFTPPDQVAALNTATLKIRKIKINGIIGDDIEPFLKLNLKLSGWSQQVKSAQNTKRSTAWSGLDYRCAIPLQLLKREKLVMALFDATNSIFTNSSSVASCSISLRKLLPRKNKWVDFKLSMQGKGDGAMKDSITVSVTAMLKINDDDVNYLNSVDYNSEVNTASESESDHSPNVRSEGIQLKTLVTDSKMSEVSPSRNTSLSEAMPSTITPTSSLQLDTQMYPIPEESPPTSVTATSPNTQMTSVAASVVAVLAARTGQLPGTHACGLQSAAHIERQKLLTENQVKRERTAQRNVKLQTTVAQLQGEMELMISTILSSMETVDTLKRTRSDTAREILDWSETFHALCGYYPEVADKKKSAVFKTICDGFTDTQNALQLAHQDTLKLVSIAKPKLASLNQAKAELAAASEGLSAQPGFIVDDFSFVDPFEISPSILPTIQFSAGDSSVTALLTRSPAAIIEGLDQYLNVNTIPKYPPEFLHALKPNTDVKALSASDSNTTSAEIVPIPVPVPSPRINSEPVPVQIKTPTIASPPPTEAVRLLTPERRLSTMFMGNMLDMMKRQSTPERRTSAAFIGGLLGKVTPPQTASKPMSPERRLSSMLVGDIFSIASFPSTSQLGQLQSNLLLNSDQQRQKLATPPRKMSTMFIDNLMRSVTPPTVALTASSASSAHLGVTPSVPSRKMSTLFVSDIMFNSIAQRSLSPPPSAGLRKPLSRVAERDIEDFDTPTASPPRPKSPQRGKFNNTKDVGKYVTDAMGNLVKGGSGNRGKSLSPQVTSKKPHVVAPYLADTMLNSKQKGSASQYKVDMMGNLVNVKSSGFTNKKIPPSPSTSGKISPRREMQVDAMGNLILTKPASKPSPAMKVDALGNLLPTQKTPSKEPVVSKKFSQPKFPIEKTSSTRSISSNRSSQHQLLPDTSSGSINSKGTPAPSPPSASPAQNKALKRKVFAPTSASVTESTTPTLIEASSISPFSAKLDVASENTPPLIPTLGVSLASEVQFAPPLPIFPPSDKLTANNSPTSDIMYRTHALSIVKESTDELSLGSLEEGSVISAASGTNSLMSLGVASLSSISSAGVGLPIPVDGSMPMSFASSSINATTTTKEKEKEYSQLKRELRKWKADFIAAMGREPVASDFPDIEQDVKLKIARKNQLSKDLDGLRSKKSKKDTSEKD